VTRDASASKTITPTVSAAVHAEAHPGITITPSVTVAARVTRIGVVAKTTTPSVTTAGVVTRKGAAAKTITPSVSASVALKKIGAVAKTVTPTVTASVKLIKVGNVAKTVTPSVSATPHISSGPLFDAVGAGASSTSVGISWSHTATAGAHVFVAVSTGTSSAAISSVTYGGTAMTVLGSIANNNNSTQGITYLYHLAAVTGGAQTVTVSNSHPMTGNSVSYTGVTSVGTPQTVFGSTSPFTQSVTCSTGQIILQSFGQTGYALGNSDITAYSGGTGRYRFPGTGASQPSLTISDATASTTFTATATSGNTNYAGIAVVLS
jgi:hypothetical protein